MFSNSLHSSAQESKHSMLSCCLRTFEDATFELSQDREK
jgi:hypothetical protein